MDVLNQISDSNPLKNNIPVIRKMPNIGPDNWSTQSIQYTHLNMSIIYFLYIYSHEINFDT